MEDAISLLKSINKNLEDIKKEKTLPRLIYAKEIAEKYRINKNKATQFCKKYGTNLEVIVLNQISLKKFYKMRD